MRGFLALTLICLFSLPALAQEASTEDMYRKYEPHLVRPPMQQQPQYQQPQYQQPQYQQPYATQTLPSAQPDEYGFAQWLAGYKQRAMQRGFNPQFLDQALASVTFLPRVIALDGKQPEHKIMFSEYKGNIVSAKRVADGRAKLAENRALLAKVERVYGVPAQYIVALWGIETNYGRITGGFDILSSLATLAYEGRRASFFENELSNALTILAGGHAGTDKLIGSWAGAMGNCQFMPSTYLKYAVDGDGDGNANIWGSMPDTFASMANYLHGIGWNDSLRWGRLVRVPATVQASEYGRDTKKPLSYWIRKGVRDGQGRALQKPADGTDPVASLVAPDGPGEETYLVYNNFNVIMMWNRSTYFATSVGLLADAIASE